MVCGVCCILWYDELNILFIVYIDCDVFFVVIEKCDNFELEDKLVIIGGGQCGVVFIVCYVVCMYGVYLVMLMFKVFVVCFDVVVIKLEYGKYI